MTEYILAGVLLAIAIALFVISVRSFMEKGFLFNNAYIHASEEERKNMDKRPYYRQTAIVFLMLGGVFVIIAAECVFKTGWLWYVEMALIAATIIYAIVSSVTLSSPK